MRGPTGGAPIRVVPPAADPAAELARLRRATGPWLHLLDAAPADARQLGWLLGQDGVVVRILRGHCGRSSYGFFDEVGAALQLPGDPAEDWNVLAGLLTDMGWLPGDGHVLVVTRAGLLLAAEPVDQLAGLVAAVREVARGRAEEGEPVPFHLVLQDDAVGLAALRERLDAVGAKHDELSGWDAEEPSTEATVGARSTFLPGERRPDRVDLAAGAAASEVDGVVQVGRGWEEFRGGAGAPVRVYAPVLAEPRRAAQVAGAVARAVAGLGTGCVVVPLPVDVAARDARQAAVAASVQVVWPVPDVPAEPPVPASMAAAEQALRPAGPGGTEPAASAAGLPPAAAGSAAVPAVGEPTADAGGSDSGPASARLPAGGGPTGGTEAGGAPGQAGGPVAGGGPAGGGPVAGGGPAGGGPAGGGPAGSGLGAGGGAGDDPAADPSTAEQTAIPRAAGGPDGDRSPPDAGPRDAPGTDFELVAANLEWTFDPGSAEPDAAEAALLRHAAGSTRTAALFRSWVSDPDGGWVRVVLGYVGPRSSIADVEAERTAVVESLQRAGAGRCCVEVLAASEVGDVHRWLEERCHPLWPPAGRQPTASTQEQRPRQQPAPPASPQPASPQPAPTGTERVPATIPADIPLTPGPGADDPAIAELVSWAGTRTGVVGLVTAYAELPAGRTLVVGVALDGRTEPEPVRTEVAAALPGARVEPFAPSRGLDPAHLRLTRAASRVWTRRAEREQQGQRAAAALQRPEVPNVVPIGPPPVRDTADPRGDEQLGDRFTLVGIDRDTEIGKGAPEPDERDAALMAWAQARPTALALLRAVATVRGETFPVYCLGVTEEADPNAARRDLAAAVAATGATKAAAEAFAPAGAISAFHLDLAVGSTRLWPARS